MVSGNVSDALIWKVVVCSLTALVALGTTAKSLLRPTAPASIVKLVGQPGSYQLLRNGKPYFIKGVGGTGSRQLLLKCGANSIRTWGADNVGAVLDQAQKDGLTVTVGIWLGHADVFDYHNEALVKQQFEMCKEVIERYKGHPALLLWALGNEMEGNADDLVVWRAINDIAAMCKRIDPSHPTMTVVAEIGGDRVKNLHEVCKSIDIIGINSYGGAASLAKRYKELGGKKPYVVTEFGPPGPWESSKTRWEAPVELSSTAKGDVYRTAYRAAVTEMKGTCLGSYAFLWGNKQEATATWFGMLLPDGSRLEPVDVMTGLWTGEPPKNRVPRIESLSTEKTDHLKPEQTISVALRCSDPDGKPLKVRWVLVGEARERLTAGRDEAVPPGYANAIIESSSTAATIKLPNSGGAYRVFAYVFDDNGGAAVANLPIFVDGPIVVAKGLKVDLPLTLYSEGASGMHFVPSGWMGSTSGLTLDLDCKNSPHSGNACAQFKYTSPAGWAGVVFQYPANDWGDKPEGLDLTGAKSLTFWMRGAKGGEKVNVEFGILKQDKTYFDTASGKLELTLEKEWKRYEMDLAGKDLSRIKSGFVVVVAGNGAPIEFFLDDARFEK